MMPVILGRSASARRAEDLGTSRRFVLYEVLGSASRPEDDDDNGSAAALAKILLHGKYFPVPGNHMSAVIKPELGQAIVAALKGDIW